MNSDAFLGSIRRDILEPGDVLDASALRERVEALGPAMAHLESAPDDLFTLLNTPSGLTLCSLLLGVPEADVARDPDASSELSRWRDWTLGQPLRGVVVGLLLKDAHSSRSHQRRVKLLRLVSQQLSKVRRSNPDLSVATNAVPAQIGRRVDFVVSERGEPILAVVVIFQTRAGGRQMQIFEGLPDLQSTLIRRGVVLAVVADGPGFANMGYVVQRVGPRLQHLMNVTGLSQGELREAAQRAMRVHRGELRIGDSQSEDLLDRVALVALRAGRTVTASLLNTPTDEAESFLVRFAARHPEYDLRRTDGEGITAEAAASLRSIAAQYFGGAAPERSIVSSLCDHLGYREEEFPTREGVALSGVHIPDSRLRLPAPLPVFEVRSDRGRDRNEVVAIVDDALATGPLTARMAVVVDLGDAGVIRKLAATPARTMRPQLAVLDNEDVAEVLLRGRTDGREFFARRIVQSVDLSLISPFVSDGPVRESMFFGREPEIRRIMEQAGHQSFALVGGRKAGKTSILRRIEALLRERVPVVFLDCQAHPDRADFLRYLLAQTPEAQVYGGEDLVPSAERILTAFATQKLGKDGGVILLDEVDDLFLTDSSSAAHPHVLSRAFRSLAQVGTAAVVVTGERALYSLTRDPRSPHWNFCTPLLIGPLSETAARDLLVEPMKTMSVSVDPEAATLALERTARHPNLLQYLGDRVVDSLAPLNARGEGFDVRANTVLDIVQTATYQDRFLTTFWSQATNLEKTISLRLSTTEPRTVDSIVEELRPHDPGLGAGDVEEALQFLDLYTISQFKGAGRVLRDPAFELYLAPVRNTAIAQQWLERRA